MNFHRVKLDFIKIYSFRLKTYYVLKNHVLENEKSHFVLVMGLKIFTGYQGYVGKTKV